MEKLDALVCLESRPRGTGPTTHGTTGTSLLIKTKPFRNLSYHSGTSSNNSSPCGNIQIPRRCCKDFSLRM
eukprot:3676190-Karenia_brevis.AAC.1